MRWTCCSLVEDPALAQEALCLCRNLKCTTDVVLATHDAAAAAVAEEVMMVEASAVVQKMVEEGVRGMELRQN